MRNGRKKLKQRKLGFKIIDMTTNLEQLFDLITRIELKILRKDREFFFAIEDYEEYWDSRIDSLNKLENILDEELQWLSKYFSISKRAGFVLYSLLRIYLQSGVIKSNYISISDIKKNIFVDIYDATVLDLREAIFELEEKNIIVITEVEHYLVPVINASDTFEHKYYLVKVKPSFVPFANKKFEFTESFIHKLNHF